jgi:hypothetical protein
MLMVWVIFSFLSCGHLGAICFGAPHLKQTISLLTAFAWDW